MFILPEEKFKILYPGAIPKGWGDKQSPLVTPDGQKWRSRTKGKKREWILSMVDGKIP